MFLAQTCTKKQNYLLLARVIKSRNYVSDFASYCCITLILHLEGIKADKHFQVKSQYPVIVDNM